MEAVNDVSSATLSNLPPDIVRIILRLIEKQMDTIRLIAPLWDKMVLEFLSYRKHHPPLAILQFEHFENAHVIKANIKTEYFLHYQNDTDSQGIFRGWIKMNSEEKTIDVQSPPLQIRTMQFKDVQWCTLISIPTILFGIFLKNYIASFSDPTSYFVSIFLTALLTFHSILTFSRAAYQIYVRMFVRPRVEENLNRLNLIASRCCFIDCLTFCYINQLTLSVLGETLGNVIVDHLYIMDLNVDENMRNNIVHLVKSNSIRIVSLFISNAEETDLRNLLNDANSNKFTLLIWENKETSLPDQVFGHPTDFWNHLAKELGSGSYRIHVFDNLDEENWHLRMQICAL